MSKLDYAVTGNGSQIIDKNGNILFQISIPAEKMSEIKSFILKHDLAIKIDNERIAYNVLNNYSKKLLKN